jgi:hypothetical protein
MEFYRLHLFGMAERSSTLPWNNRERTVVIVYQRQEVVHKTQKEQSKSIQPTNISYTFFILAI